MEQPPAPTAFQLRVYAAVCRIPHGRVASYSVVGRAIGCRSAQVVGQALRKCQNPAIPCHRVVATRGLLGGFGGKSSGPEVDRKRRLLEAEGVRFAPDGRIDSASVLRDGPRTHRLLGGGSGN